MKRISALIALVLGTGALCLFTACSDSTPVEPNPMDAVQLEGYVYETNTEKPIAAALVSVYKNNFLIGSGYSNNLGHYEITTTVTVPGTCYCTCYKAGYDYEWAYLDLPTTYDWYLSPQ